MSYNNRGKSKDIVQKIQAGQSDIGQKEEQEKRKEYELRRADELRQKLEMMRKNRMQQSPEMQALLELQRKMEIQSRAGIQQKTEAQIQFKPQQKIEIRQKYEPQQKTEVHQWPETKQKAEIRQQIEPQEKVDAKKKDEFQTLVKKHENEGEQPTVQNHGVQKAVIKPLMNGRTNEDKKQIQHELMECSRAIRDIQSAIKETYQFKPCRQLCELLVNIRQNVYTRIEDIQEDLGYVLEGFGIDEFTPQRGDVFEAKCHDQVYSNVQDARGREIERVYSSGFKMDGDVIMKAQVSVKQ